MKRAFDEISDDEWEHHSFKPSRVLNQSTALPPPAIESFAFKPHKVRDFSDQSSDDCVEVTPPHLRDSDLEDDDVEPPPHDDVAPMASRGRRFVVEDEEDDVEEGVSPEVVDVKSSDEGEEEVVELDDDDVVGKALQKCAKISAELRRELYGSSSATVSDRYSEVEASAVRIVTQVILGASEHLLMPSDNYFIQLL